MILFLAMLSARLLLISLITLSNLIALPAHAARPSFIKQQPFQAIFEINNNKTVTIAITQLMKKGAFYYHNKAYDSALLTFDQVLFYQPKYAKAYHHRALAKAGLGQLPEAIMDYNIAIALNPHDGNAFYNRGNAKAKLELYRDAIADYDKAIALNPSDRLAKYNRSMAYERLVDFAQTNSDCQNSQSLSRQHITCP